MKVRPQGAGCRENRFFWQLFYYRQYSRFVIAWATIFCFYCPASFSLHLAFFHLPGNFSVLTNSSDVFINLLPYPYLFHELFSVWAVEKENKFLIGPIQFFFSVCQLKKKSEQKYVKKLVNSDFEIGETIIRVAMKIPSTEKLIPECWKALMMVNRPVKKIYFYRHEETLF